MEAPVMEPIAKHGHTSKNHPIKIRQQVALNIQVCFWHAPVGNKQNKWYTITPILLFKCKFRRTTAG